MQSCLSVSSSLPPWLDSLPTSLATMSGFSCSALLGESPTSTQFFSEMRYFLWFTGAQSFTPFCWRSQPWQGEHGLILNIVISHLWWYLKSPDFANLQACWLPKYQYDHDARRCQAQVSILHFYQICSNLSPMWRWEKCPDTSCTVIQNPLEKDKDPVPIYFEMNNCKLDCPKVTRTINWPCPWARAMLHDCLDQNSNMTSTPSADGDHADEQLHGSNRDLRKHDLRPNCRDSWNGQTLQGIVVTNVFGQINPIT